MFTNPFEIVKAFNEFRANFRGNPQQEVEKLVQEGKITRGQLEQLSKMANEVQAMLNMTNDHLK